MSQYVKTNWKKGDTISSEKMNKIENELEKLSSTDSGSGLDSLPMIEFIVQADPDDRTKAIVTLGESKGILDQDTFVGMCLIRIKQIMPNGSTPATTRLGTGAYMAGLRGVFSTELGYNGTKFESIIFTMTKQGDGMTITYDAAYVQAELQSEMTGG